MKHTFNLSQQGAMRKCCARTTVLFRNNNLFWEGVEE